MYIREKGEDDLQYLPSTPLVRPRLLWPMVEVEDGVRASPVESKHILAESHRIWSRYREDAQRQKELQPCSVRLRNILGRVPAFPAASDNGKPLRMKLESRGSNDRNLELLVSGRSTWRTGNGQCGLPDKIIPHQLLLGTRRSTLCTFATDGRFANWPGVQGEQKSGQEGNYLAILAFAWAYILSAHWAELQQQPLAATSSSFSEDRHMRYIDPDRDSSSSSSNRLSLNKLEIDIGNVDSNAARWWDAILRAGEGWRAEITRNDRVYRSPWSIYVPIVPNIKLRGKRRIGDQVQPNVIPPVPPSSEVALAYLSDFCMLHDINSQSTAALATTLTFPFLSNKTATLPLPKPFTPSSDSVLDTSSTNGAFLASSSRHGGRGGATAEEGKLLNYYMTLSCDRRGLEALLCGSFFNPAVSCHLVDAWLEPIFDIIDPLITAGNFETLAMVMGKRQPKLAALWTGAIISGMAKTVFQHVRLGLLAVELHASAWTATTHTFMSLESEPVRCPVRDDGLGSFEISRSDECRLLYLAGGEEHSRLPVNPWRPFGSTPLRDTDLDVQIHANCTGHYLLYTGWSWDLVDAAGSKDCGFINKEDGNTCPSAIDAETEIVLSAVQGGNRLPRSEIRSGQATRSLFGWLRSSGWPPREKNIYSHPWIASEGSDESDEELNLES